jgi:hypothetical protein
MKGFINRLPLILLLLCAAAFSLKGLREPDLWWQIRTGQWILEHHAVPNQDVFSYTYAGTPWINIKWGYEVIASLIAIACGPECLFVLQALVAIALMWLLYRLGYKLINTETASSKKSPKLDSLISIVLSLGILLPVMQYRMNGRPEMTSHLMSAAYLYLLLSYAHTSHRRLWLLIPLQLIWVNMHEAYGLGIVMVTIYLACSWLIWLKDKATSKPITLTRVWATCIAALVVNPYGIRLLTRPLEIFNQVQTNKYTVELMSFTQPQYWTVEAYLAAIIVGIVGCSILYSLWLYRAASTGLPQWMAGLGLGYWVTLGAMLYLASTANRNIIFLGIFMAPAWVMVIDKMLSSLAIKFLPFVRYGLLVLLLILYVSIVSGYYYRQTKSRDSFGLGVRSDSNPIGAADYVASKHLTGKCFSDYLTSSYLLWRLQPDFKTYIDLRDLDVFPASFMDSFFMAANSPTDFNRLDKQYDFKYVILYANEFSALHSFLYNDSIYACTYIDPIAAVYEKTDNFTRNDIFSHPVSTSVGSLASIVNLIFNPLYNQSNQNVIDDDIAAASYYKSISRISLATIRAERAMSKPETESDGARILGDIELDRANQASDPTKHADILSNAYNYYQSAIRANPKNDGALLGLCAVSYARADVSAAMQFATQAFISNPENAAAHIYLAKCLEKTQPLAKDKIIEQYQAALALLPRNPTILYDIGATALAMDDCHRALSYWQQIVDVNMLNANQRDAIQRASQSCR